MQCKCNAEMRKNYTIRIEDENRKKLKEIAESKNLSLGSLVYHILLWYIKNHKKVKLL